MSQPIPVGTYVVAGLGLVSLSDTVLAPLVVGALLAAVIYNATVILSKKPNPNVSSAAGTGGGFSSGGGGGGGGGGFGSQ